MATAFVCVAILYAWVVVTSANGLSGDDLLIFLFFAVMGTFAAYIFAETMTSLCLILKRQRFVWQALVLLVTGSVTGYLLFLFVTGGDGVWSLGSFIGLALVVLRNWQPPRPELTRWGLGAIAGILAALLAYLLLKPTVADMGEVISAALFTAVYIFWSVKT